MKKSVELLKAALEKQQAILGDDHPDTTSSREYLELAQYAETKVALSDREKKTPKFMRTFVGGLGKSSTQELDWLARLALNSLKSGRTTEANRFFDAWMQLVEARPINERGWYGEWSQSFFFDSYENFQEQNDQQATAEFLRSTQRHKSILPEPLSEAVDTLLAIELVKLEKYAEAERLLLSTYRKLKEQTSPDKDFLKGTAGELIKLYTKQGDQKKLKEWQAVFERLENEASEPMQPAVAEPNDSK